MGYSILRTIIVVCLTLVGVLLFTSLDSAAQINLAWDPNTETDLAGYRVYYGIASGTYGAPADVGNVTAYTLNGLTPGVTYYIAVTAYDTVANESGYSNEVSGQITETVSAPTMLGGPTSGISGTLYPYTTGGSYSNLGHSVQYQFDWAGDGTDLSSWSSASAQSKSWASGGTYSVRARARCANDTGVTSSWSGLLPVTIAQGNPTYIYTVVTSPSGLQVTVDGVSYAAPRTFTWAAGSSHTLSVPSPQNVASGAQYAYSSWSDGAAQSHTVTVPSSNTVYTAQFTLAPSAGLPAAPSNLRKTGSSSTSISMAWQNNATNQTGFRIQRSLNGTTWSTIAVVGSTTATYVNQGLTARRTYYYRVQAYNSSGFSGYSNVLSATTR
jgi:hypothetical protein